MVEAATRVTLTREAVVATARQQIVDKGLDAISLRQIGAALGVTAPALYAYVADKRDLLRAVAEGEFRDLISRFAAVEETDPIARLRELSRVYVEYATENPELFKTMFLFPPELTITEATGQELPIATQAFNYAVDAITDAMNAGVLRQDLDPTLVTFTSWTATHGLATVLNLGFNFDDATKDLLIDLVLDTVLAGLSAK
ncbi:MAG: TetR/AcrR family transcriptional regulator [Acidimicrobiales bacterium]|nr:TetR/AcrR family transcriptional regulator [Acidimicrobiales bacterium]